MLRFRSGWHAWFSLLPLLYLWVVLIRHLSVTWSSNPQYAYGWAVPFLCLYLALRSEKRKAEMDQGPETKGQRNQGTGRAVDRWIGGSVLQCFTFIACAALWTFARFAEQAVPGWRGASWAMALGAVGITLVVLNRVSVFRFFSISVRSAMNRQTEAPAYTPTESPKHRDTESLKHRITDAPKHWYVFPVCFFLVSVPWPTVVENTVIRTLTFLASSASVELLNLLGIPAVQRGAVIELASGVLGIDEACSGIRSFQATLMISLFLNGYYRLKPFRCISLVIAGIGLSVFFNVARMTLLSWVASNQGVRAVEHWHDPTGVTILLGCFFGLWVVGKVLASRQRASLRRNRSPDSGAAANAVAEGTRSDSPFPGLWPIPLLVSLSIWLLVAEIGVATWFRPRSSAVPVQTTSWTLSFPDAAPVKVAAPSESTRKLLQYDRGREFTWQTDDGVLWQAFFLEWTSESSKSYLVQRHRPDKCMPMAGSLLKSASEARFSVINGVPLAWRSYRFLQPNGREVFIYYFYWEAGADAGALRARLESKFNIFSAIRNASRINPRQKVLEIATIGYSDEATATVALQQQLERIIVREK